MAKQAVSANEGAGRAAVRQVRRQQLIDATIDSIAKKGFSGTTLETVTKGAKLSHGVVNFYFKSKEQLYVEALGYLADEHYAAWHGAMEKAGAEPADQLAAIVEVDFDPQVSSHKKIAVWFAFWGQAKYRPNYLKIHNRYDLQRFAEIRRLCTALVQQGGYTGIKPESAARGLEALIDGLWLSILMYGGQGVRKKARCDAFDYLAICFPKHFGLPGEGRKPQ